MYEFRYHRAGTIDQARELFQSCAEAKYLAGGQTLLPVMKQRLSAPSDLIDLKRIAGLSCVDVSADTVRIGAATSYHDIATSAAVRDAMPSIARLASLIGDPAVRYRGTIGGSLANNDPAADFPAAVLALDATITTDRRTIRAEDYFQGLFGTALDDGEMITEIAFPIPSKAAYEKFRHPASRFALTGVFVAKLMNCDVRVAATGASQNGVVRVPAIEKPLRADWSASALDDVVVEPDGLIADLYGSAAYRSNLIKILAQRAVAAA